jgi:hypothetical protein
LFLSVCANILWPGSNSKVESNFSAFPTTNPDVPCPIMTSSDETIYSAIIINSVQPKHKKYQLEKLSQLEKIDNL